MGVSADQLPMWLASMDGLGRGLLGVGLALVVASLVWLGHLLAQRAAFVALGKAYWLVRDMVARFRAWKARK